MARRVLIVDDDDDFSALLSDVFRQAEYEVEREATGRAGLKRMESGDFHVVVSDHRMPEMTGLEFVEAMRKFDAVTPVIVVSGYLDNATIRRLIRNGVNGIFTKPLNIFSLLKKSDEEIQRAEEIRRRIAKGSSGVSASPLEFEFHTFPCASHLSKQFARRAYTHREFSRVLFLVGEAGVPFASIARELSTLSGKKELVYDTTIENLDADMVAELATQAQARGFDQVLVCILGFDQVTSEQDAMIQKLIGREAGVVAPEAADLQWRLVLCCDRSADDLYDDGRIGEEIYLAGGINQLHVPSLRSMPEDIGHLAQRFILEYNPSMKIEPSALVFLAKQRWKRNVDQLREVVTTAADIAEGTSIRPMDLKVAMDPERERVAERITTSGPSLKRFLQFQRDDYLHAVLILNGGNRHRATTVLDHLLVPEDDGIMIGETGEGDS